MHGEARRDTRKRVGARVREVRERKGLSRRALSDLSDVPEFTIGFIENGRMRVIFEGLLCLARALEVPVVALFDEGKDGVTEEMDPRG